jgi:Glycosyl hydrolase family 57
MSLSVYALFHLNLAFSSIEEEDRPQVIERCYWPLLRLAEQEEIPIAIEATGFTLERIAAIAPDWIAALRRLIAEGRAGFVGSGYVQLIGPLVPAAVNRANLRLGHNTYERLLGLRPSLALPNEQAYSGGLLPLYAEAGYRALVMDYDNCAPHHPEWPRGLRYAPQSILGAGGPPLDLIWTNTVAFQKVQRLAHGELEPGDYIRYIRGQIGGEPRAFALYGNDAEVFDFRPGRMATEAPLSAAREWDRLAKAFGALRAEKDIEFLLPEALLTRAWPHRATGPIRLETPGCPVPVKKQHKYNITRWAVTGRDDLDINTRCYRLYHHIEAQGGDDEAWGTLCGLWASDFRTHVTDKRWARFQDSLKAAEDRFGSPPRKAPARPALRRNLATVTAGPRLLEVETPMVKARLKLARGLALDAVWFGALDARASEPLCGTLPHGHLDDVRLAFDWYSGTLVYDRPARPKITDLVPVTPEVTYDGEGAPLITAVIDTPLGKIRKSLRFALDAPRIDYDITLDWSDWSHAALRLGNFTLLPRAFDPAKLALHTQNGGEAVERFSLDGGPVDHGTPVSLQVSANCALGMTGGWAELGDDRTRLRVTVEQDIAALVGLVTARQVHESQFCRLSLSALEFDETRRPSPEAVRPRRFRYSLGLAA